MSNVDLVDEAARSDAVSCKESGAVAVRVFVDCNTRLLHARTSNKSPTQVNCFIESLDLQNDENRAENLLLQFAFVDEENLALAHSIALHFRLYVRDDGGANEIAALEAFDRNLAAIELHVCALVFCRANKPKDALF